MFYVDGETLEERIINGRQITLNEKGIKEVKEIINNKNDYIKVLEYEIKDVKDLIDHELNCHILKNDEDSWNLEYYSNGKLDYRKLLIGLLNDINSRLGDSGNE